MLTMYNLDLRMLDAEQVARDLDLPTPLELARLINAADTVDELHELAPAVIMVTDIIKAEVNRRGEAMREKIMDDTTRKIAAVTTDFLERFRRSGLLN